MVCLPPLPPQVSHSRLHPSSSSASQMSSMEVSVRHSGTWNSSHDRIKQTVIDSHKKLVEHLLKKKALVLLLRVYNTSNGCVHLFKLMIKKEITLISIICCFLLIWSGFLCLLLYVIKLRSTRVWCQIVAGPAERVGAALLQLINK